MRQALDGHAWASLLVADIAPVVRRRRCCRRQLLTADSAGQKEYKGEFWRNCTKNRISSNQGAASRSRKFRQICTRRSPVESSEDLLAAKGGSLLKNRPF